MRILMLTDFYPPIVGGVEQHVRNLSIALTARGHQVAVATLGAAGGTTCEMDEGVRVYRIRGTVQRGARLFSDAGRRFAPPLPDPEALLALRRVLSCERPHVVHAHNWMVHSFLPLKRARRAPLVMTLHDYNLVCAKRSLLYKGAVCSGPGLAKCLGCATAHYGLVKGVPTTLANFAMGLPERAAVDMFLPVSTAVATGNDLARDRLPFEVIPNFVPDDIAVRHAECDLCLADLPQGPFLLFVGALGRHKGIEILLDAYRQLADAPPLVLIGAPWADTPTEFPPNVRVFHNWPHDTVMQAWARCAVAIVPSIWPEPCPTVVMEAMAMGRPVVATHIGGLPDLVADGESGILVPPGDAAALARALDRLLARPELREQMGQVAQERVGRFLAGAVVGRIEHVYHDLLGRRRQRRHS